jgi:hypothetical protein
VRETPERDFPVPLPGASEIHGSASPAAARVSPEAVKQESRGLSEDPSEYTEAAEDNELANRTRSQANIKKGTLNMLIIRDFVQLI